LRKVIDGGVIMMSADEHAGGEACSDKKPDAPDAAVTAVTAGGTLRKNTVGLIALICGMIAAVLICVSAVEDGRMRARKMDAIGDTLKETRAIGREPTPEEERAIHEKYQKRVNEIEGAPLAWILIAMGWPGVALTFAAIVLGIIGLRRKGARRDVALAGLLLGIGIMLMLMCLLTAR